jgi:hypothetical protein
MSLSIYLPDISTRYKQAGATALQGRRYPWAVRSTPRSGTLGSEVLRRVQEHGEIDYRLARRHTVAEYRRGRLSRLDVCDAHPELLRAARNVGEATARECPICEDADLVLVSFAFGRGLPPSGKCVASAAELAKLAARRSDLACYVVEVCPSCSWNHLARTYAVGSRPSV